MDIKSFLGDYYLSAISSHHYSVSLLYFQMDMGFSCVIKDCARPDFH